MSSARCVSRGEPVAEKRSLGMASRLNCANKPIRGQIVVSVELWKDSGVSACQVGVVGARSSHPV
jgi:hypothetical protein